MSVHWILVGVAIGIGLILAPLVFNLALVVLPYLIVLAALGLVLAVLGLVIASDQVALAFIPFAVWLILFALNEIVWHRDRMSIGDWCKYVFLVLAFPAIMAGLIDPSIPPIYGWTYWGIIGGGVLAVVIYQKWFVPIYEKWRSGQIRRDGMAVVEKTLGEERWRAGQIRRNGTATVEKDLREPS
jgi:hypothetical protein